MSSDNIYSILDRPEILQFTFYPRKDARRGPPNSTDYSIPVGDEVSICCRFYVHGYSSPSILFFHGNGEVVSDYDGIAPIYNQIGINLFVTDYRGYGLSGGTPTFTNMVGDAHRIFKTFLDVLRHDHHTGDAFVMGRSLGSIPAIDLALCYQEQMKGLIIESGLASMLRLLKHLGFPTESLGTNDITFPNAAKMRTIALPTLILHGEYDSLIPVTEARDLFENAAAERKRLVIINGADHNDIMLVDIERYFTAIKEFVFREPER
jgi:alpha-beta hydrolase superfamily lysophospholipase